MRYSTVYPQLVTGLGKGQNMLYRFYVINMDRASNQVVLVQGIAVHDARKSTVFCRRCLRHVEHYPRLLPILHQLGLRLARSVLFVY